MDLASGKDALEVGVAFGKKALTAAVSTAAQGLFNGVGTAGMKAAEVSKTGLIAKAVDKAASKGVDAVGTKIIETGLKAVQTMATGTINSAVNAVTYKIDPDTGKGNFGFDGGAFKSGVASAAVSAGASIVQTITAGALGYINNNTVNTHEGFSLANKINAGDFANFVGGIAGEAVNYAHSGTFNLNVLRLKSENIDTGLLELHLGQDGATMNIGTGGVDASLGTVGNALKGAAVLGTNALVSIYETATDRKDIAEMLRSQYGYGDAKQKAQLFSIITGMTALNLGGNVEYDGLTEKKGLRREVTLAGYHEGMSVNEQLQLGIVLGHEAYRDGIMDKNNEAETVQAVKGHTEMGVRMVQDGKFSVLTESLVKDINAYFNENGGFAEYAGANYDSSADYLALVTRSDGTHWYESDGKKDLTITSQAIGEDGEWETVRTKTVEMPGSASEAETLVMALGEKRVDELLRKSGIVNFESLGTEEKAELILQIYSKDYSGVTHSDTPLNGYINGVVNSKGGLDMFVATATLTRFELSYSAVQGLGIDPTAKNNKALDMLTFTKDYINGNKPTEAITLSRVQSVDVYSTVLVSQKNEDGTPAEPTKDESRHQPTGITVSEQELEGNTVISDFSLRVTDGKMSSGADKVMIIHNAYALNGRFIDKNGENETTGGGPWLIHDSTYQVSDGCFILPGGTAGLLKDAMKTWGLKAGDEVTGKLSDWSNYRRSESSVPFVYDKNFNPMVRTLYW
jgi:hypothetical protein